MFLVEARDVIDEAEASHFGSHRFEYAAAQVVLVRYRLEGGKELSVGPLYLDVDCEEDALVVLVSGEQNGRQFVEVLQPCDAVMAEFDLGAYDFRPPTLLKAREPLASARLLSSARSLAITIAFSLRSVPKWDSI